MSEGCGWCVGLWVEGEGGRDEPSTGPRVVRVESISSISSIRVLHPSSFILNSTRPLSSFLSSFLSSSFLTHPVASHFKALLQVLERVLVLREGEVRVGDVVKDTRLLGRVSHLPQDIQTLQVPEEGRGRKEEDGRKTDEIIAGMRVAERSASSLLFISSPHLFVSSSLRLFVSSPHRFVLFSSSLRRLKNVRVHRLVMLLRRLIHAR